MTQPQAFTTVDFGCLAAEEEKSLIDAWYYGPSRFMRAFQAPEITTMWRAALRVRSNFAECISLSGTGALPALLATHTLPWESSLFGVPCTAIDYLLSPADRPARRNAARALIEAAVGRARVGGTRFLSCKVYTDDLEMVHALEAHGFYLVDTALVYVIDIPNSRWQPESDGFVVRAASPQDRDAVAAAFRSAFRKHFGRFQADPQIPSDIANSVYERWVEASFDGYADHIVVAESEGGIVGASFWKNSSTEERAHHVSLGHYSIGAVRPEAAGQGVFIALTQRGMRLFEQDARFIEGPTHVNNYPVQRGYERLGWKILDATHTFHLWL